MATNKWTNEQEDAINERDCNLLVAAAAGAGKTAVLVERIIRKITDDKNPVDIDKLLIVTFTNAAATEMRDRIAEAISERLEKNSVSGNIQRQLTLLGKASITTIHSFCLEVIRSNIQSIKIDPAFRIADETESALMILEALSEVFEEQYEKAEPDFFKLLDSYGGSRDDQALQNMALNLYNFIQSSPFPDDWLNENTNRLKVADNMDFSETMWGGVLIDSVKLEFEGLKAMMTKALNIMQYADGLEKYKDEFLKNLNDIEALLKLLDERCNLSWDRFYKALNGIEYGRLSSAGKNADKEKQESVKAIRDDVKNRIKKLREKQITANSSEIIEDMKSLHPIIKHLADLVIMTGQKYAERKNRKSVLDFNDLEHFCLEILSEKGDNGLLKPSKTALRYRERFEEILVDEYQDSNLVQEKIVSMISRAETGKPNVFMVGDVKQSIYRFRQARPELFLEKYKTYSPDRGNDYRKILLYRNFRSRNEIVDAINFIFRQIMSAKVGELDYTDVEALKPGAHYPDSGGNEQVVGGTAEFHIIQTETDDDALKETATEEVQEDEEDFAEEEMLDNVQCEARLAGKRILEMTRPDKEGRRFCIYDRARKEYRKTEFRDIVILLRATKNWSETFMTELSAMGIPAFADTGTGFFKTVEVQVMLSLLQIIDNPLQDIPLLSVLRSPFVAFSTDELAELRRDDKKAYLFDELRKLAENENSTVSKKASAFIENLKKWREMSLYVSTDQLLWHLYTETGYYTMVGAMPAGEKRQANLRVLFERAKQFEETSYQGLFNFISFIDKLKVSKGDMGSAVILSENDNVVRIMSVHKSKGLEFPVVILSGCGKKFNLQDMNKSILLHQDLGFGPEVVDYGLRMSWPSAMKQAIREKIRLETLSEEMRILYVALTRAREKLIITGCVNSVEKVAAKWASQIENKETKLPVFEVMKGVNFLDWIGLSLLRHKDSGKLRGAGLADKKLREMLIDDPSGWDIRIWNKSEVLNKKIIGDYAETEFINWLDNLETVEEKPEIAEEISKRLSWDYPYERVAGIPAKISVTEMKRRFHAEAEEEAGKPYAYIPNALKKPMFLQEKKGLSAAEKGVAFHFFMQHLDYRRDDFEIQIKEMVDKNLLTQQQAQSIDTIKIHSFFSSDLGKRMLSSGNINREVKFNLEIPCYELYEDMSDVKYSAETLLLQGIIDCYFEEPDGLVLVDYKTDYVETGQENQIKERYGVQIDYYARALTVLTGKKIKAKYIYLFHNDKVLEY